MAWTRWLSRIRAVHCEQLVRELSTEVNWVMGSATLAAWGCGTSRGFRIPILGDVRDVAVGKLKAESSNCRSLAPGEALFLRRDAHAGGRSRIQGL